ncbi:hypothetical protein MMC11_003740 [Xylographa trunciseda]|nr:hypothetical protein [Xylographa trunciseda]
MTPPPVTNGWFTFDPQQEPNSSIARQQQPTPHPITPSSPSDSREQHLSLPVSCFTSQTALATAKPPVAFFAPSQSHPCYIRAQAARLPPFPSSPLPQGTSMADFSKLDIFVVFIAAVLSIWSSLITPSSSRSDRRRYPTARNLHTDRRRGTESRLTIESAMHLPLLSRVLFLLVQFLILTIALPAAKHAAPAPSTEQLTEREATADAAPEPKDARGRRGVFGKRVAIDKLNSPVKAMVRSPDTLAPREKTE